MLARALFYRLVFGFALAAGCVTTQTEAASACVWKVTGPSGGTLFLGGSIHALRSSDYPLPPAYNRAFDASSRLVFEADPKALSGALKGFLKAGRYPRGDNLKNHVDRRTYDYLRRFFSLLKVPEEKFMTFRPWFIELALESPPPEYFKLGVEEFLSKRALANSKPISGLESLQEAVGLFSGLNDRESEALLLTWFVNSGRENPGGATMFDAWHRGDAESIARFMRDSYRDFPAFGDRLIGRRNRNWIPKIEGYLRSGQTCFVVVGVGHMGGPDGLLSLLRARFCKIEQL